MTIRISRRLGVSVGAIMAVLGATPALADDTMDMGPVKVTLGGFIAMEGLYRSRNEGADIGSSYSAIPFSNAATGHTSEMRFSARQSRLSVLAQGDINPDLHLAAYYEMDFLGGAQTANSNESNSFNLRIRNIYTTLDSDSLGLEFLAGQNWSLLTLNSHGITPRNEVIPTTIDAQYAVGFNWARQPQLRVTKNWDKQLWVALSLENPQTTIAPNAAAASGVSVTDNITAGNLFDKANTLSLNHIPDVIAKVAWEPEIGGAQPLHMEAFGIYRDFYDRTNIAAVNAAGVPASIGNHDSTGTGIGGSITFAAIPKVLDLQITAMTGTGIGRYGSGQLPDVTLMPNGNLKALRENTVMVGGTLHATPMLDIYTYLGMEGEPSMPYTTGNAAGPQFLGLGNPGYKLGNCFTESVGTCSPNIQQEEQANIGLWYKAYQGSFGSFRLGLQYSYTHLAAFPGAGLTTGSIVQPKTDDSMVFTSVRYYPF